MGVGGLGCVCVCVAAHQTGIGATLYSILRIVAGGGGYTDIMGKKYGLYKVAEALSEVIILGIFDVSTSARTPSGKSQKELRSFFDFSSFVLMFVGGRFMCPRRKTLSRQSNYAWRGREISPPKRFHRYDLLLYIH